MTAFRAKTPVRFTAQDSTSEVSQWNSNDPTSGDRLKDKITNFVSDRRNKSEAIQATSKPKPRRGHCGGYDQLKLDSSPGKEFAKFIAEQLCETRGKIKLMKQTDVVSGVGNLRMMETLKNRGNIKRLLSQYMKSKYQQYTISENTMKQAENIYKEEVDGVFMTAAQNLNDVPLNNKFSQQNDLIYDKRTFVPFSDERDHLGRIINSEYVSYMQLPPQKHYIKKHLVFRPKKDGTYKLEVGDEVPRRWKENWRKSYQQQMLEMQLREEERDQLVAPPSPHKNREYFDKMETIEFKKLEENIPEGDFTGKLRNSHKTNVGLTQQPSLGTPLNIGIKSPKSDKLAIPFKNQTLNHHKELTKNIMSSKQPTLASTTAEKIGIMSGKNSSNHLVQHLAPLTNEFSEGQPALGLFDFHPNIDYDDDDAEVLFNSNSHIKTVNNKPMSANPLMHDPNKQFFEIQQFKNTIAIEKIMRKENRGSKQVFCQTQNNSRPILDRINNAEIEVDHNKSSSNLGIAQQNRTIRVRASQGLQSRVAPEIIDPLVNMLLGNTNQRLGTAQFKSKTGRKAFENPAFIGYCSGPGPTIGAYNVKEPILNKNRMITFDRQLPRESFVCGQEGFSDFTQQQNVLKKMMTLLSETAASMTKSNLKRNSVQLQNRSKSPNSSIVLQAYDPTNDNRAPPKSLRKIISREKSLAHEATLLGLTLEDIDVLDQLVRIGQGAVAQEKLLEFCKMSNPYKQKRTSLLSAANKKQTLS